MAHRTRIKVCGITRVADAVAAVEEGVDALGLVFYALSPRCVEVADAVRIARAVPAFVSVVALFVDAPPASVAEVIDRVRPDLLQFHGGEDAAYCRGFGRPYLKAIAVRDAASLQEQAGAYGDARGLLLDSYRPGVPGGTGTTFDWDLIPAQLRSHVILAGGLRPENVAEAIRRVRPYAVDVSGGVELSKGIKDRAKIRQFIEQVQLSTGSQLGVASA